MRSARSSACSARLGDQHWSGDVGRPRSLRWVATAARAAGSPNGSYRAAELPRQCGGRRGRERRQFRRRGQVCERQVDHVARRRARLVGAIVPRRRVGDQLPVPGRDARKPVHAARRARRWRCCATRRGRPQARARMATGCGAGADPRPSVHAAHRPAPGTLSRHLAIHRVTARDAESRAGAAPGCHRPEIGPVAMVPRLAL